MRKFLEIEAVISSLNDIKIRNRRSSFLPEALEIARQIGSAATIFIKGYVQKSIQDNPIGLAKYLFSSLFNTTKSSYEDKTLLPYSVQADSIGSVSDIAVNRPDELKLTVMTMDYELEFFEHSMHELNAGMALITSIRNHLVKGFMDTQALGDLIEDSELLGIDPATTKILEVSSNIENKSMKFKFLVTREMSWLDRVIPVHAMILFGQTNFIVFICTCLFRVAKLLKSFKDSSRSDSEAHGSNTMRVSIDDFIND